MPQPQVSIPQLQNLRAQAQAQAIARTASQGVGTPQLNQQPQQSILQQGQIPNPMQNTSMTPQQMHLLQQMQFQQRQVANNNQMLANLSQNAGVPGINR